MNLKELRQSKGLSQESVAKKLGVPRTTYRDWERGRNKPTAENLEKIAEFFGIEVNDVELEEKVFNNLITPAELNRTNLKKFHGDSIYQLKGTLEEIEQSIYDDLEDVKKSFFLIGYKLTLINKNDLFLKLGYDTIVEYAEDKFGFGKSSTYNFINVYDLVSSFNRPLEMKTDFSKYNFSQLVAMSGSHWANDDLPKYIDETDSVEDIKQYIRYWNKYNEKHSGNPKETVKEYLKQQKLLSEPKPILNDVAPGQIPITLDEPKEETATAEDVKPQENSVSEPFNDWRNYSTYVEKTRQNEEQENISAESSEEDEEQNFVSGLRVPSSLYEDEQDDEPEEEIETAEEAPAEETLSIESSSKLNTDWERRDFIENEKNYTHLVLDNAELGLRITRLDLSNGAFIYRTEYKEFNEYDNYEKIRETFCLVDPYHREKPEGYYNLKDYSPLGTQLSYIINYLRMHKDSI